MKRSKPIKRRPFVPRRPTAQECENEKGLVNPYQPPARVRRPLTSFWEQLEAYERERAEKREIRRRPKPTAEVVPLSREVQEKRAALDERLATYLNRDVPKSHVSFGGETKKYTTVDRWARVDRAQALRIDKSNLCVLLCLEVGGFLP